VNFSRREDFESVPDRSAAPPLSSHLLHAPLRAKLVTSFAAVYLLWGSTFLFIRYAVATIPPFFMAGTRHLVAGALLYPLARSRSREKPSPANWSAAVLLGGLLLLAGNGAVSWAEQTVPSGVAALLVATVSLWMVILDWLRPGGLRPTAGVVVGVILAFAGMVFLVGPGNLFGAAGSRVNPLGAGVLLFGSFCWATGSVFSRRLHLPANPLLGTAMQSLAGGGLLFLFGFLTGELSDLHWAGISLRSALSVGYLIVFGSLLGFSAYTWLLRAAPPARVATYAYVNPVVALFLGWAFAGERLTLRTFLAAAVIIAGVVLVITAPQRVAAPLPAEEAVSLEPPVEPEDVKV
jgi:drug/metabolite transporter (DMT)-like permease